MAETQFQGPQAIFPCRLMSFGLEGGNVTFKLTPKSFYDHSNGDQLALPLWGLIPCTARDRALFQVVLLSIFLSFLKQLGPTGKGVLAPRVSSKQKGDGGREQKPWVPFPRSRRPGDIHAGQ